MSYSASTVFSLDIGPKSSIPAFLTSCLPYSLPLLRRLEHHRRSSDATVFATFSADNLPQPDDDFALLFVDHSTPPGTTTDGWIFTSLDSKPLQADTQDLARHLTTLLRHARQHWPVIHASDLTHRLTVLKLNTIASSTAAALRSLNHDGDKHKRHPFVLDHVYGPGGPYRKYILSSRNILARPRPPLPQGLVMDTVEARDFNRVMANNSIVRSVDFLVGLASLGMREVTTGELVVWAFLGPDGAIRTVHCEEVWRRKGLAKVVIRELIAKDLEARRNDDDDRGDGDRMQHGDVAEGNKASVRLFEGFGGRWKWDCYWVWVDLRVLDA